MVTVYDMTSGTLRQELEVNKPSTPAEKVIDFRCEAEDTLVPMLQEVQWEANTSDQAPEFIAAVDIDNFIHKMK